MRDRYYRLLPGSTLPSRARLVRISCSNGRALARLEGEPDEADGAPDLILFRAALARIRHEIVAIFIRLEDGVEWDPQWGDLFDYRGGRIKEKPALQGLQAPALDCAPGMLAAWDYTLNLNSITSPSLTT